MKRSKFSEAQIAFVLKQVDDGTSVGEVCRKAGISEATVYNWRKKCAGCGSLKMRTRSSNGWWQSSASTRRCCRMSSRESSKA
ncbi:transposase [Sphingobium xenophagum]